MHANIFIRLSIATTFILGALVAEPALAKKGGKPGNGGGGGGGTGAVYQIVALDDWMGAVNNGEAHDINNLRESVGFVDDAIAGTGRFAAYWSMGEIDGEMQSALSLLTGGESAYSINDSGEIVGSGKDANGRPVGLYWSDANALPVELPPLAGHNASTALAINGEGVICGVSGNQGGVYLPSAVAWRVHWQNEAPVVFGPVELPGAAEGSTAVAINNTDANGVAEIAGYFGQQSTAVVWSVQTQGDGSLSVFPLSIVLDADADASGINNSGTVCGQRGSLAVIWDGAATTTLKRPTKGKNRVPWTRALDISSTGVIVGRGGPGLIDARAVVWADSGSSMLYLDESLDNSSPLLGLSSAEAVNDAGEIVGRAWNGAYVAFPN